MVSPVYLQALTQCKFILTVENFGFLIDGYKYAIWYNGVGLYQEGDNGALQIGKDGVMRVFRNGGITAVGRECNFSELYRMFL